MAWCCFLKSTFSAGQPPHPDGGAAGQPGGRTRLYWTVTGGGNAPASGDSKTAAEEYEALREKLFCWTAEGGREKMEDSYFVALGLRECGKPSMRR